MSTNISDIFTSIPGLKADFTADWIENTRADWKIDWDMVPGGLPGALPVNTAPAVISGTPSVGQTLSVSNGTWTGNPAPTTFTYEWRVDGTAVTGATSSTYVVQGTDIGFLINAVVTAQNSLGNAVSITAPVLATV